MVGAIGQGGHPLAVPLGFLFPEVGGGSVLMDTALYFSSLPSRISSTSEAFNSVTLVARVVYP